jgi:hypothetical protein
MLTHSNIVSNVKAAHEAISIGEKDRCLSFCLYAIRLNVPAVITR